MSKHRRGYNPIKGVNMQTRMLVTESVGYGVAVTIAGTSGSGLLAFQTGSSLAGIPSLAYGAGNVMKSLDSLYPKSRRRK